MSKSLLSLAAALSILTSVATGSYIEYSTVTGFFLQDEATTVPANFSYVANNFGLIAQVYPSDATFDPAGEKPAWERFENYVGTLNAAAPSGTQYKILYLGRHGEGYHNVAETYYGTPAWNCYWAELNGNGTINWSDAEITPNGAAQAVIAHNFWISQGQTQGQSLPQSYYTSPLSRCLETSSITFSNLTSGPFSPLVKELFREGISMHTCDRRSNKTYIHDTFPTYRIEAGFTEFDELWKGFEAETSDAEDVRLKTALDSVFGSDESTFISVTSHSGAIASMLHVLGHQVFGLVTGAVIPVLVRAETVEDGPVTSSVVSWSAEATCTVPPITSLATGGCVCPSATSSTTSTTSIITPSPSSNTTSTTSPSITGTGATSIHYTNSTTPTYTYSPYPSLTTSLIYTTYTSTFSYYPSGQSSYTSPVYSTTTITKLLSTTTCTVSATPTLASTASIVYTTISYILSIGVASGHTTTEVVPIYTTVVPVSAGAGYSSGAVVGTGTGVGAATGTGTVVVPTSLFTGSAVKLSSNLSRFLVVVAGVVGGAVLVAYR